MAYVPPKGFVAGYAGAKLPARKPSKPTTPTVGATNPYQAPTLGGYTVAELAKMSPSQIALISANLAAQGPDYSKVDFEKLRGIAASAAQSNYDQSSQPVWIERGWNTSRQKLSSDAATNFAAAMASILQGGKTGQEGMDYALQNYGGSYLGAIAGRMGQELISRQQDYFTGEDAQLAGELNKLWDQMPGEREKMYEELVKQGMEGVLTNHRNAIVALAALQDSKRKDQKALTDATKALGGGATPKAPYPIQAAGGWIYRYDPNTGTLTTLVEGAGKEPKTVTLADGRKGRIEGNTIVPYGGTNPVRTSSTKNGKAPQAVLAKIRTEIKVKSADWATPTEVDDAYVAAALQAAKDRGVSLPYTSLTARYVADPKFFKNGRWTTVLPGGFTNDPKKAKRAASYQDVLAQALDVAQGLYDLGWSEARVNSWVRGELRRLGFQA